MQLNRRHLIAGLAAFPLLARIQPAHAQPRPLVGLVIGNDKYRAIRPLERAAADARSIAAAVRGYGYDLVEAIDADTDATFAAFAEFKTRMTPGAAAFFYFAGHGLQVNGTNFLMPLDVDGSSSEKMLETSLPLGNLLDDLAATRPAQAIVMLDACRDTPVATDTTGAQQGFASVQAPGGFFIAYSAGSGETALDRLGPDDPAPNGVFTRHLLRTLAPDRAVDAIMRETRCNVSAAAESVGHRQHPAIYDQSRYELRLDGRTDPAIVRSAMCTAGPGRLHQTAVLLIACQTYSDRSQLADLATPRSDARALERSFKALGAETVLLENPGRDAIREACAALAKGGHDRIIIYFAGMGELVANEAAMFVIDPAAPKMSGTAASTRGFSLGTLAAPPRTKNGDIAPPKVSASIPNLPGVHCVFLSDLVANLQTPLQAQRNLTRSLVQMPDASDGPRLVFLLDFCLSAIDLGIKPAYPSVLATLQDGNGQRYDHVAAITGGGIFQTVLDAAEGQGRSPFAIALDNALARPGLSLRQFAEVVRDEVEAITKGMQTPAFFARPSRRGDRFVERVPPAGLPQG